MLYFGSRNFGQANFGQGVAIATVDEALSTSSMDVHGYRLLADCTLDPTATTNIDVAAGIQRMGHLQITPTTTVIMSGVKMEWVARVDLGIAKGTVPTFGYIAWDSQYITDTTWTTQEVD